MVPVPAKAEFGIQGPASAQTLHPSASSHNFSCVFILHQPPSAESRCRSVTTVALDVSL